MAVGEFIADLRFAISDFSRLAAAVSSIGNRQLEIGNSSCGVGDDGAGGGAVFGELVAHGATDVLAHGHVQFFGPGLEFWQQGVVDGDADRGHQRFGFRGFGSHGYY
jgi:hypothetical protein